MVRLDRGTRLLLAAAALLALLALITTVVPNHNDAAAEARPLWAGATLPLTDPAPPGWLANDARWQLRVMGDRHPEAAYWGKVTYGQLAVITGDHPGLPDKKTYVFIAIGSFSTRTLSHPAGASFPDHGRVIVCEYDVQRHELGSFAMMWGDVDIGAVPGLHAFMP